MIPESFRKHYRWKKGRLARDPIGPQIKMSLEQYWEKWKHHWHNRHQGPNRLPAGETMVMGRCGDKGHYTVENCRVITHRQNTLERDHKKCASKLSGKVHNPKGKSGPIRRVKTPLGEFRSCVEAGQAHQMHRTSIWHRVKSDAYPDFEWR